jgi:hypothetical protein
VAPPLPFAGIEDDLYPTPTFERRCSNSPSRKRRQIPCQRTTQNKADDRDDECPQERRESGACCRRPSTSPRSLHSPRGAVADSAAGSSRSILSLRTAWREARSGPPARWARSACASWCRCGTRAVLLCAHTTAPPARRATPRGRPSRWRAERAGGSAHPARFLQTPVLVGAHEDVDAIAIEGNG